LFSRLTHVIKKNQTFRAANATWADHPHEA